MATLLDPRRLTVVLDTGLQSGETRPGAWVPRRRGDISDQTVGRASRTRRLRQSREAVSLRSFLWSSLLLRRPSAWLREGGRCLNPSPPLLLHLALPQALPTQGEACSLGNCQPGGAGAACQEARSRLWLSSPTTSPCDLPCSGHIQRRWSRGKLSPLWGLQSSPVDLVRTFFFFF